MMSLSSSVGLCCGGSVVCRDLCSVAAHKAQVPSTGKPPGRNCPRHLRRWSMHLPCRDANGILCVLREGLQARCDHSRSCKVMPSWRKKAVALEKTTVEEPQRELVHIWILKNHQHRLGLLRGKRDSSGSAAQLQARKVILLQ